MATTFDALATVEVGSGGVDAIEFTSISGSYTDLCLLASFRSNVDESAVAFRFNSNSGTNYSYRALRANAGTSTADSVNGSSETTGQSLRSVPSTHSANIFSNCLMYITNYAGSNNKGLWVENVVENNAQTAYINFYAPLWSQTSAITSIRMYLDTALSNPKFVENSTITLYGIKNS